ncbi:MAG: multicopper oxidase domain-containing protein [Candidatus Tectomicrobia bacterium]|nr:multicopper oxidase domain-containing protein [Candidatus Tectomicrobia bacterium]
MDSHLSRRDFLKIGTAGAGLAGSAALLSLSQPTQGEQAAKSPSPHMGHEQTGVVGDITSGGFDPTAFLTMFDYGEVSQLPNGQTLREYTLVAIDKEIEIVPGVIFPAWTYNGTVPGPTLRAKEGDRIRVHFTNKGSHEHTIHFHGIHASSMDGVFEQVLPGKSFVYEFDAEPFGLHLYHCHTMPLKRHIHKGLYGTFLIDPPEPRPPARELVMVMNGFDTNFDGENEFYAANTVAFHYQKYPIKIKVNELVRIYLVNLLEFDLINSMHLHANFFRFYKTGTNLAHYEYTDTVMMCQGERGILEFSYKFPGLFMFHAHQSEFAELGWTGFFEVVTDIA